MVVRRTQGPVQITSIDTASLNYALRDLQERIDELSGLRGRAFIFDRLGINSPADQSDAVDLQSLLEQESRIFLYMIRQPGDVAFTPGVIYSEIDDSYRQPFDFQGLVRPEARVIVRGWGTEAGAGKGVAIHDGTSILAQVLWDGNAEDTRTGDFTAISLPTDTVLQLHAQGSSVDESLILTSVVVEFKVVIQVTSL